MKGGWKMNAFQKMFLVSILVVGVSVVGFSGGLGAIAADQPETFPCVAEANLEKDIAPEAALEELTCFMKKWEGSETLHFKVTIKNVSDKPQRFRVNLFLDNGKAVGGLIPQKTKKGLVEPGATAGFVYPVGGMSCKPKSLTIRILTMAP
jgi:hypothetical protein